MELFAVTLDQPAAHWVIWQWISVSYPNLIMIVVMLALFVLALVLPFPGGKDES
jgi:hypothetical protein